MGTAAVELREVTRRMERHTRTFKAFVEQHNPSVLQLEHVPRLIKVAERVLRGELRRVMILGAPRYLKSEIFTRLLPACYLRRHLRRRVGLISHGASLAWDFSEEVRSYFLQDGGRLTKRNRAKQRWSIEAVDGGVWAMGVGGIFMGRGFNLGVIDDPTDPEKVTSPTYQRRFQEWYPAKFLSRQDPNSAIVFVMQRLGMGDPVDFLLRREVGEGTPEAPQYWHIVVCDEIKSDEPLGSWDGPMGLPPTCTLEPDSRPVGALLAPSLFDKEQVAMRRREAGPYVTSAQRQQRPMAASGDFWKKLWFENRVYDQLPPNAYNGGKDWDTAYTKDEANSASAWVHSYRGVGDADSFPIYIENVNWDWLKFPDLVDWMKELSGPHYVEDKASGKSAVQTLGVYGITAEEVAVSGDKFARAAAAQPAVSAGRVFVKREVLETLLTGEEQGLLRVTAEALQAGKGGLDLNDAFVQAIHRHLGLSAKKAGVRLQFR